MDHPDCFQHRDQQKLWQYEVIIAHRWVTFTSVKTWLMPKGTYSTRCHPDSFRGCSIQQDTRLFLSDSKSTVYTWGDLFHSGVYMCHCPCSERTFYSCMTCRLYKTSCDWWNMIIFCLIIVSLVAVDQHTVVTHTVFVAHSSLSMHHCLSWTFLNSLLLVFRPSKWAIMFIF